MSSKHCHSQCLRLVISFIKLSVVCLHYFCSHCSFRPQPARPPPPWLRHRNRDKAREEEEQKERARQADTALGGRYPPSVVDRLLTMNQEELDYDLIVAVIRHICDHLGVCALVGVGLEVM